MMWVVKGASRCGGTFFLVAFRRKPSSQHPPQSPIWLTRVRGPGAAFADAHLVCSVLLALVFKRFHEARCRAACAETSSGRSSSEAATVEAELPGPLAPAGLVEAAKILQARVDTAVNVTELGDDEMLRFLHVTNDEMTRLRAADEETALEIMKLAIVAWRPGGSIDRAQRAPLRAALAY